MKEILGSPLVTLMAPTALTTATTTTTNTVDVRSAWPTAVGSARHVSIFVTKGPNANTNAASAVYVLSHGATTDATNQTTLSTITQGQSTATAGVISRFEVDMLGLQPVLKLSVSQSTAATSTNDNCVIGAVALGGRVEQTPLASSGLAGGTVVIISGGVTQSN